jgi:nucleoside-diphosphate-sugar epimerase
MATVLVTGAAGHIGRELARRARSGGLEVRVLVRSDSQSNMAKRFGWSPVRGDLLHPDTLVAALDNTNFVVHSAAYLGSDPSMAREVNVEGTRSLARLAMEAGVSRFVHISTMSVHGEPIPDEVSEESPLATMDPIPYCSSKALAERALGEVRASGLETVVLRPGAVCNVLRSQWGNEMVENMLYRGWPEDTHPDDVLPWVHTSNLAEMTWLALTHPSAANEAFIAVDRNVALREFFVPVADALGQRVVKPDRPPIIVRCQLGKIGARLGYKPIHTFEQAMEALIVLAKASR